MSDDDGDRMDEEEEFDCALRPDGQCALAGTADCDWDCPYSHGEFYAGSDLWHKKHNAGVPVDGCECAECITALRAAKQLNEDAQ